MIFQNVGGTYTWSDETAQEIETVWENSDSALSHRPLTTALFSNKQLYIVVLIAFTDLYYTQAIKEVSLMMICSGNSWPLPYTIFPINCGMSCACKPTPDHICGIQH